MSSTSFVDRLAGKPDTTLHQLLLAVRAFVRRFVRIQDEAATLIALWIAMTHARRAFAYYAYIHVTSPLPECGKSRVLEVLDLLVDNAWKTEHVPAAVLARKIDRDHPTLLLDESDAAFNGDPRFSEALRGILTPASIAAASIPAASGKAPT